MNGQQNIKPLTIIKIPDLAHFFRVLFSAWRGVLINMVLYRGHAYTDLLKRNEIWKLQYLFWLKYYINFSSFPTWTHATPPFQCPIRHCTFWNRVYSEKSKENINIPKFREQNGAVIEAAGTHNKRCVLKYLIRYCLFDLWTNTSAQNLKKEGEPYLWDPAKNKLFCYRFMLAGNLMFTKNSLTPVVWLNAINPSVVES